MKWWLIKLLCIAAGYLAGAWAFHEPLAGLLTAPFGWILGKAGELHGKAREMGGTGYRVVVKKSKDIWGDFSYELSVRDMVANPCNPFFDEE